MEDRGGLSSHVRDRVVMRTTLPFALGRTTQPDTCDMTTQPFAWDRTTQLFTSRDSSLPAELLSKPIPPPFPAFEGIIQFMPNSYPNIPPFEGIIYSYQRVNYLNLSERLDINCGFTLEPNHAIC